MYKYIKAFQMGYLEGIDDAVKNNYKERKFKKIDDKEILSKLYDIGYIKGYKKITFKNNKNIV